MCGSLLPLLLITTTGININVNSAVWSLKRLLVVFFHVDIRNHIFYISHRCIAVATHHKIVFLLQQHPDFSLGVYQYV